MAHNAGCVGILVQTGFGDRVLAGDYQHHTKPDYIAKDLAVAVEWILQQLQI
jgi:D-glycero-D-manno-heptose 1,7-bisphosphate phosphatase